LKLYIEFPEALPNVPMEPVQQSVWERVVVLSDSFGAILPRHRIRMAHDCRFVPVPAQTSLLALARVAGYYGGGAQAPLPGWCAWKIRPSTANGSRRLPVTCSRPSSL
jgi:hypothetical protein